MSRAVLIRSANVFGDLVDFLADCSVAVPSVASLKADELKSDVFELKSKLRSGVLPELAAVLCIPNGPILRYRVPRSIE